MQRRDRLGPYVLDECLGSGGEGEVGVATDPLGAHVGLTPPVDSRAPRDHERYFLR